MELRARENRPSFKRKRDNYARKLKEKKLINYLRSELRTCTTHGLPYIVNTDIHWFERLFWAISFLISIVVIVALLLMQYNRYANTPVVNSVEMDYFNWNISFPAITLCPMYKIEDEDLEEFVNETLESTGENIYAYLRTITTISYDTADVVDFDNLEDSTVLLPKDYAVLVSMVYKKFDSNSITTSTNWPITVETSMTEMGMCHVINSNVAVLDNPTKWTTAQYQKSNIDLSVHERDFFVQIINYADVYKVYIHSPDEPIQSTSPSYTSKSNNYIEFGVRVWSTRIAQTLRSVPIGIRKCRFLDEPLNDRYPVYTYSHCLIECRIKMILKLCDCIPHLYKPLSHERICRLTELSCWMEHMKEIVTLSTNNETLTLSNITNAEDLPRSSRDCNCVNNCDSDVYMKDHESFVPQDNYNSVRVGISSFPKVRVLKDAIVNLYDIILRSGGVINLCIGTSVISLVELIVLFAKLTTLYVVKIISLIFSRILRYIRRFKIETKKITRNKKQY